MEKLKSRLLTKKYVDKLNSKFNILDIIDFKDFDTDFDVLKNRLTAIKKEKYQTNEKIVFEHFDTDFYHKRLTYGLNLYNLIETIKKIDIPFFTIILVTNHFGIKNEIDKILKEHNEKDFITVIETFVTDTYYNSSIENFSVNVNEICFSALSMLGAPRSHRFALYHYLKHNNLLNKVHVSIKGFKNNDISDRRT